MARKHTFTSLRPEIREKVEDLAVRDRRSVSAMIEILVEEALSHRSTAPPRSVPPRKATRSRGG